MTSLYFVGDDRDLVATCVENHWLQVIEMNVPQVSSSTANGGLGPFGSSFLLRILKTPELFYEEDLSDEESDALAKCFELELCGAGISSAFFEQLESSKIAGDRTIIETIAAVKFLFTGNKRSPAFSASQKPF